MERLVCNQYSMKAGLLLLVNGFGPSLGSFCVVIMTVLAQDSSYAEE